MERPTPRARQLRKSLTKAEALLWSQLSRRQFFDTKFSRQIPIGPYIVDFVSRAHRLIIEVDGGQHGDEYARDMRHTAFLKAQGYTVMRFWNNEVLQNLHGVLSVLADEMAKALSRTSPYSSPAGRGEWSRRLPAGAEGEGPAPLSALVALQAL